MTRTPSVEELKSLYLKVMRNLVWLMLENFRRPRDPATIFALGQVEEQVVAVTKALKACGQVPDPEWVVTPPMPSPGA
ncbi:hypothetical protein [Caulobacter sp. NIBR2454]|uniref:hypothetical protein n=1 Tax=Caulobacter sp. NIBR2454 TaxID=3015996 RepID=UPI0022B6C915|nr:hypothetical protein [Caulobacter sp. NIBR2454]